MLRQSMSAERSSLSETNRAADHKRPDLDRLRAAWATAADALHAAERAEEAADAMRADRDAQSRFMAILAHELKNPLTSLRSAVEALPLAKSDESRSRLLAVIQHDVKRLDRLITDIADASRLDAEMQRQDAAPVDLKKLLTTVVSVSNDVPRDDGTTVRLAFEGDGGFMVLGEVLELSVQRDGGALVFHGGAFRPLM